MSLKPTFIKLHRISTQFGLDPLRLVRSLRGLPVFWRDYRRFRSAHTGRITLNPCLHDSYAEGGVTKSEYFWQDLLVARWIHEANPKRHVDVGSRTDGFVAHVASFREIEVFDVRPITTSIPGVAFHQADVMNRDTMAAWHAGGYCDSLSCLHVLEHFGLGRYGDPIRLRGFEDGFTNLVALLEPGGRFYLSTPIGQERVEFNANWVFDPCTILQCAERHGLQFERFTVFHPYTGLREINLEEREREFDALAAQPYHLGIFVFIRPTAVEESIRSETAQRPTEAIIGCQGPGAPQA